MFFFNTSTKLSICELIPFIYIVYKAIIIKYNFYIPHYLFYYSMSKSLLKAKTVHSSTGVIQLKLNRLIRSEGLMMAGWVLYVSLILN